MWRKSQTIEYDDRINRTCLKKDIILWNFMKKGQKFVETLFSEKSKLWKINWM